ncbi:MAG: hypothetical protein AB7H80_07725 [Candidatus Kapaibacterium sp.]
MQRYRFLATCLGTLFFFSAMGATAQTADTVWYMEWARFLEGRDGDRFDYPPMKVWFDADRAYVQTDDEKYFTIVNDSIYLMSKFFKNYSFGPIRDADMSWITNLELTWKRRRGPSVSLEVTNRQQTVLNILGREINTIIKVNANQFLQPVRLNMFVAQEEDLPIPTSNLSSLYRAFALAQTDFSIDYVEVNDSLKSRGLVPLTTAILSLNPKDTFAIVKSELTRIERVAVSKDFFFPPTDFEGLKMDSPTEAQRWELTAIPLPGGPRKKRE